MTNEELGLCPCCGSGDMRWCSISVRAYCGECNWWAPINYGSKEDGLKVLKKIQNRMEQKALPPDLKKNNDKFKRVGYLSSLCRLTYHLRTEISQVNNTIVSNGACDKIKEAYLKILEVEGLLDEARIYEDMHPEECARHYQDNQGLCHNCGKDMK